MGDKMKRHVWLMLPLMLVACTIYGTHPVYRIGMNFQGLDTSEQLRGENSYTFHDTVSWNFFSDYSTNNAKDQARNAEPVYSVVGKFGDKPYTYLLSPDGKILWKTYDLIDPSRDQELDKLVESDYETNEEYSIIGFRLSETDGVFLEDKKTMQTVFKKIDGTEIRIPLLVTEWDYYIEGLHGVRWLFYKCLSKKPAEFIAVDQYGSVLWKRTSGVVVENYPGFNYINSTKDRILVHSQTIDDNVLFLISTDGSLFEKYMNITAAYESCFIPMLPSAPSYAILSDNSTNEVCIYDTRTGCLNSKLICDKIDMTQIGDKLIAVVAYEHIVAVVDVLSGKLLQDLTPPEAKQKNVKIRITKVKISPDAKEVWFSTKDASKKVVVKHYKIEK